VLARDVVKTRLKRGTLAKVEGVTQHASPGLSARSALLSLLPSSMQTT